jgi:Flp pilus assembly protein TadD
MYHSAIFSMHMPDVDRKSKEGGWSSQAVLLHEYGHHFSYNNFPIAYPYWFSEGFAEFNATARFDPDGSVVIGLPVNYRAPAIKGGGSISPNRLFAPERYGFIDNVDLLYGRGWLLTHFLMLRTERAGQLKTYLNLVNNGTDSLTAAGQAFGDLKALNKELNAYAKGTLAPPLRISPSKDPIQVTVRTLSPGEAEMAPIRARFITGIREGYRTGFAAKAASIAERYPTDATVQEQWAEAELVAERFDRADAAADAALRLDPKRITAMVIKGLVAQQRLEDAKSKDGAAWTAVRSWFVRANKTNPNTVLPLFHYYSSFIQAKETPTPAAVKGLMRAQVLAPESPELRAILARQLLLDGDARKARAMLQSLAFAPHRKRDKNVPKEVIDLIDAGKIAEAKAAIDKVDEKDDEDD